MSDQEQTRNQSQKARTTQNKGIVDWPQVIDTLKAKAAKKPGSEQVLDNPIDIIDTWTILEALSPQSYQTLQKLAYEVSGVVHYLTDAAEPWTQERVAAKGKVSHYLVHFGAIPLEKASQNLSRIYLDEGDKPMASGLAALGSIVLNEQGIPVNGFSLSSFGWAYGRALQGALGDLAFWTDIEKLIRQALNKIIYQYDQDTGELLPLSASQLIQVHDWLITNCELPETQTIKPEFAIRVERRAKASIQDLMLLNSFYLDDISKAKHQILQGVAGKPLLQYLGIIQRTQDIDLINDQGINSGLASALEPIRTPLGRWPGAGRFPLVLLQQAAVNIAFKELQETGLFSINGPPGTGKTTLLRDILAGVIVARAKAMSAFTNPRHAFKKGDSIDTGNGFFTGFFELDDTLRGHEILVASSNNNAVENISKELPLKTGIAQDLPELQYFRTISDALASKKEATWGLVAATLGNSTNRKLLTDELWWNEDTSLQTYFRAILNKPSKSSKLDPKASSIAQQENAPANLAQALQNWHTQNAKFKQTLATAEDAIMQVQLAVEAEELMETAQAQQRQNQTQTNAKHHAHALAMQHLENTNSKTSVANELITRLNDRLRTLEQLKPGFLKRLFQRTQWTQWQEERQALLSDLNQSQKKQAQVLQQLESAQTQAETAKQQFLDSKARVQRTDQHIRALTATIAASQTFASQHLRQTHFWTQSHEQRQITAPNLSDFTHRLRDQVFVAAIQLHKAFIDACAFELNQNLRLYFREISGNPLPENKRHLAPQLWSTLSLITPVVSSTFASVGKMLSDLPPNTFGWLFIDEAGQATPQAALGAISRSKRVIAVGDPLQVPPVTSLPLQLIESIAAHMGVNHGCWMPDWGSVQTLADNANAYGTVMDRDDGFIRVGSPLLVHRRCDAPMFSMSNELAYGGLMVQGKAAKPSQLKQFFGPSRWYDIRGTAQDKWCEQEGELVIRMLTQALKALPELPDLYIISPFRIVAQTMRRRIRAKSALLQTLGIQDVDQWVQERVGTVHTFQGKEAEAVILLLGAPTEDQSGARHWATSQVNILNVAVSRAKACFYVVGNKALWGQSGHMQVITAQLPKAKTQNKNTTGDLAR